MTACYCCLSCYIIWGYLASKFKPVIQLKQSNVLTTNVGKFYFANRLMVFVYDFDMLYMG